MCGLAPEISRLRNASGRKALMGTAFHAVCDGGTRKEAVADVAAKLARLTPDERAEIAAWKAPTNCRPLGGEMGESVTLTYMTATREQPVGLDVNGCFIEVMKMVDGSGYAFPKDGCLVPATPDMYWVADLSIGKVVFVGDIKTGEHPITGGALSLQFVAPALALADKYEADWICTGIWWAREGRWEWSEAIAVDSELAVQLWQRIRSAATNPPQAVTGAHCSDCWQRAHCPEFMLPVSQAETKLAPLTQPGGLTADNAVEAFLVLQAMSKLVEVGKDTVKAFLRENGPVPAATGKVLTLQKNAGREGADLPLLRADGLTKYIKQGAPFEFPAIRKG